MSDSMSTILLAGGGTGGHLYPGIAVAQALREQAPHLKPLFLCTQREIDRIILEPTGFEFIAQPIQPLVRSISGLLRFWKGWRETKDLFGKVLNERTPVAVLGLGGYAAGVAVRAAGARKVSCALLNPDVIPGKANQFLMQHVQAVFCQFEATREHVSASNQSKLRVVGCPIRPELQHLPPREQAASRLHLDPALRTLVITGASLGAKTINDAVLAMVGGIKLNGWQILHLSGREHADAVRAAYREAAIPAVIIDFTPAMADVWAVADLAISRSGASSCAELTACGVPSVLLPYPFHRDMHQRLNAKVLADAGAAVLIDDEKDASKNADKLRPVVEALLSNAERRHAMSAAAREIAHPDAAERVATSIAELAASGR